MSQLEEKIELTKEEITLLKQIKKDITQLNDFQIYKKYIFSFIKSLQQMERLTKLWKKGLIELYSTKILITPEGEKILKEEETH